MKWVLILMLVQAAFIAAGQNNTAVTKAEQAFAQYALDSGVKKAFLRFMDSTAVVFQNGEVLAAPSYWKKAPEGAGILRWRPAFSVISADGDLGFTTGPYEYQRTLADTTLNFGQYSTIWHKNNNDWKFIADLGTVSRESGFKRDTLREFVWRPGETGNDKKDAGSMEAVFIKKYMQAGNGAYDGFLTENSTMNMSGHQAFISEQGFIEGLKQLPEPLVFEPVGMGKSGDRGLEYAFGMVRSHSKKGNYLRVWAATEKGWKLLLQTLAL